ncbi:MAG: type IV conjugative transfer system protein TraL [Betaproteobacteria bacterium]|nr:type IV conjugative transfer system protein TraL [Betaproteobacteria bacterium]
MNDNDTHEIPRRLNDFPKLFFWDLDVGVIFGTCFVFGTAAGSITLGLIAGMFAGYGWSRLKSGKHPAYAIHWIYWHLPVGKLRRVPPSYIREMLG